MKVFLASRNAHKIEELRRMAPGVDWLTMPEALPDPPETGDTFAENALQKATFVFERTGFAAVADDSGLVVDALGGRPGVHSRRYSPEATDVSNNRTLLAELSGIGARSARYVCVIALVDASGSRIFEGRCEGSIGTSPKGINGFGYDPLFFPVATPGRTMAELAPAEKDELSHRGEALRGLLKSLAGSGKSPT